MHPQNIVGLDKSTFMNEAQLFARLMKNASDTCHIEEKRPFTIVVGWLFWLNGPLRQYFSLYRAVSQREGERKEK